MNCGLIAADPIKGITGVCSFIFSFYSVINTSHIPVGYENKIDRKVFGSRGPNWRSVPVDGPGAL
jgi:hypothetical protein